MIPLAKVAGIVVAGVVGSISFWAQDARAQAVGLGQNDECSEIVGLLQGGAGRTPLSSDVVRTNWKRNAECLVRFLGSFRSSRPVVEADYLRLSSASGALRAIVENNGRDAIAYVRSIDTNEALEVLAFSARSGDKGLRLNSTFIIANIIDNQSACVVVDHLFDPALPASEDGRNGRANLLGALRAIANWADPFVKTMVREAIEFTDRSIAGKADVADTKRLIADLDERLRNPIANAPKTSGACPNYNPVYGAEVFARVREPLLWQMSIEEGTSLTKIEARRSIKAAFCYQEERWEASPNGRFLVLCHRTGDQCNKTRGPNRSPSVRQSECQRTEFADGASILAGGGHDGALYHYNASMYGAPFPSVPDKP